MFIKVYSALLIFFIILKLVSCQVTQNCIITKNNATGVCRFVQDCPRIYEELKVGKRDYTVCPNSSRRIIVCCPIGIPNSQESRTDSEVNREQPLKLYEKKCLEYLDAVYEKSYTTILIAGGKQETIKTERCGFKVVDLIIGGENAKFREFPHMTALGYKNQNKIQWACGGSLISEAYVITAAHCTKKVIPDVVRIGDLNINSSEDDDHAEEINVEKAILHPNYDSRKGKNDIALLKLERNINIDTYKRPACLPSSQDWLNSKAIVTGWGRTDSINSEGSDILQKVTLDKFTEDECKTKFDVSYRTQICAGSKKLNKEMDTCQGDSGGPLQIKHPSGICMWQILGVTSLGSSCGAIYIPAIYTRVYPYNNWIESIVWQ